MEVKVTNGNSHNDSQDTDSTEKTSEKVTDEPVWSDILPFFNFVPYFVLYYVCWYYFKHNIIPLIFLIYVIVPLVDYCLPLDHYNLEKRRAKAFEKDSRFLIPLYLYWVMDFVSYFWAIYTFTYSEFYGVYDQLLLIVVTAHIGGVSLTIGHEMLHRRQIWHKV